MRLKAKDFYKDFWKEKNRFDNRDYPENSKFYNKTIGKVIGKFKDDACFQIIKEFFGSRSKMYSYIKDNNKNNKAAKVIKKIVIKNSIKHEDYKNTLFNNKQIYHAMKTIQSDHYQLASYELNKVSLSCLDDKRFNHDNGITSYAYGNTKFNRLRISQMQLLFS